MSVCCRKSIPLNANEGIYIQDNQTGKVRSVMGPLSYMLKADEELHDMELDSMVDSILQ